MGLFSKLFSKEACSICSKEEGVLGRTKLADGAYICSDCRKKCSPFFKSIVRVDLEHVKKHMEYMDMLNNLYEKEFATLPDESKKTYGKDSLIKGITFADDIGMFEIYNSDTKKYGHKELFRYDEIFDFKAYGKLNAEGSSKKYSEVGVTIKMLKALDVNFNQDSYVKDYAEEFTIATASQVDNIDESFLYKHLNRILGISIEGKLGVYDDGKVRTEYRQMHEIDQKFDRNKYKALADEAERRAWGKTKWEI